MSKGSAFPGRGDGIFYCLTPRTRSTFPLSVVILSGGSPSKQNIKLLHAFIQYSSQAHFWVCYLLSAWLLTDINITPFLCPRQWQLKKMMMKIENIFKLVAWTTIFHLPKESERTTSFSSRDIGEGLLNAKRWKLTEASQTAPGNPMLHSASWVQWEGSSSELCGMTVCPLWPSRWT